MQINVTDERSGHSVCLEFKFEIRDLWVGVFWDFIRNDKGKTLAIYICLLPTLPFSIKISRAEV